MELYIFNRDLELKGILDTFISLRWIRRFHKSGEFQLNCMFDINTLNLLKPENIIYRKDDLEAGYIETLQIKLNETGQEYLEIKGKFLTNYLNSRISWERIKFDGGLESLIRKLINDNVINPKNINRRISNLVLGDIKGFNENIKYSDSFGNILGQLEKISTTNNIGFRNILDIKTKKIIFDLYKGVNRTVNNSSIAPCIFSREFENILNQEYVNSFNNYKNTTLIAGAGEGNARKITYMENGIGLDRHEIYVDARDISDKEEKTRMVEDKDLEGNIIGEHEETYEAEIPWDRYEPLLLQRGKEKLSECQKIETFNSKINIQSNNVYKKDYDLGDVVTIRDKKWNLMINERITEIEEIFDNNGKSVNVMFGNQIPSIIDKIKQVVR
ncbi:TPA: siphovirus ReqiPepy6 Gp37-like family protein [Clostridium botulinum]|uniref:siphovirus ReqiPepy6 Gp37-like family protein n=1 Tax=Clostridium botulinum TaxID=1491 RepID=UPI0008FCCDEC|nr:siphovirus ReqiPepy6 Gp37-like family protein [Clostridium botulinum]APC80024.1 siphovirus ReqiPepy6 Gp37-like family protein [Clostridium botulinum]MCS4446750.1 siphovirus ReqiPepy6 Gp37-like family protein [Clostridium botulinum]MCS4459047.1 siphovirus ReqiPepy6 Gp37-like family protein [Clostridium botulinum]MCS4462434.1 siphovirus ReqiPepy6 Gp37-like family protein [Clostridium botulinum]MCS4513876.1 siphovirus ReqiPepy6 Gp37-like family protein [Clostridium botulinum]